VTLKSSLGDAESSLGDAVSSLGDATSSLGDAKSSLGDATSSLGDAKSSRGVTKSSLGDAKSSLGDAKSSLGDVKSSLSPATSSLGDAKSSLGDATSFLGDAKSSLSDATSFLGDAKSSLGDAKSSLGDANSGNSIIRTVRFFIPVTDYYDGTKFFALKADGTPAATPLFVVLVSTQPSPHISVHYTASCVHVMSLRQVAVELTDFVFAIDNVPALFGVAERGDVFVVAAATLFGLLGLRSSVRARAT
jgi:hypothetical protein